MNAKERNLLIAKYVFLALVAINILNSIWVIISDRMQVVEEQEKNPDDWYDGRRGKGYYAKFWFIACVVVMVVNDLLSLGAFFGVYRESSQIVMIYSALMFVVSVYSAYDIYIRNTYSGFLVPLVTGIVGMLYASLNHLRMYEGSEVPDVNIRYVKNSKPHPTTPPVHSYADDEEEVEKLKLPDP